jgi:hypothetical protein
MVRNVFLLGFRGPCRIPGTARYRSAGVPPTAACGRNQRPPFTARGSRSGGGRSLRTIGRARPRTRARRGRRLASTPPPFHASSARRKGLPPVVAVQRACCSGARVTRIVRLARKNLSRRANLRRICSIAGSERYRMGARQADRTQSRQYRTGALPAAAGLPAPWTCAIVRQDRGLACAGGDLGTCAQWRHSPSEAERPTPRGPPPDPPDRPLGVSAS